MFSDQPVTPARLEILLETLREFPSGLARDDALRLLQPEPLAPGGDRHTAKEVIKAAGELELVGERDGRLKLTEDAKGRGAVRDAVVGAFERQVLGKTDVEPYLALFYAFWLGLEREAYVSQDREEWATRFNDALFPDGRPPNPFNSTKHTGVHRWYAYLGLGWYDGAGNFQANPYDRVRRALPGIFTHRVRRLSADDFLAQLAERCPELDGGALFRQANRRGEAEAAHRCTLGLSQALIELEADGVLRLSRPGDSAGWSLAGAEPPLFPDDPERRGSRLEFVALAD